MRHHGEGEIRAYALLLSNAIKMIITDSYSSSMSLAGYILALRGFVM